MEKNGWLRSRSQGGAKERKNYRITPAGRRLLKQLRGEVEELYRELVLGEEPEHENEA
jgi:DNA-binding PadR family transcriptional regulator